MTSACPTGTVSSWWEHCSHFILSGWHRTAWGAPERVPVGELTMPEGCLRGWGGTGPGGHAAFCVGSLRGQRSLIQRNPGERGQRGGHPGPWGASLTAGGRLETHLPSRSLPARLPLFAETNGSRTIGLFDTWGIFHRSQAFTSFLFPVCSRFSFPWNTLPNASLPLLPSFPLPFLSLSLSFSHSLE